MAQRFRPRLLRPLLSEASGIRPKCAAVGLSCCARQHNRHGVAFSTGSANLQKQPTQSDEILLASVQGQARNGAVPDMTVRDITRVMELAIELQGVPGAELPDPGRVITHLSRAVERCDVSIPSNRAALHALILTILRPDVRAWMDRDRQHRARRRNAMLFEVGAAVRTILSNDGWPSMAVADIVQCLGGDTLMWPNTATAMATYLAGHAHEMESGDLARMLAGVAGVQLHDSLQELERACEASTSRLRILLSEWRSSLSEGREMASKGQIEARLQDLAMMAQAYVAVGRLDADVLEELANYTRELAEALAEPVAMVGASMPATRGYMQEEADEQQQHVHHALNKHNFSRVVHICRHVALLGGSSPPPAVRDLIGSLHDAVVARLHDASAAQPLVSSVDAGALLAVQVEAQVLWSPRGPHLGVSVPKRMPDGRWTVKISSPLAAASDAPSSPVQPASGEEHQGEREDAGQLDTGAAVVEHARGRVCVSELPLAPMTLMRQMLGTALQSGRLSAPSLSPASLIAQPTMTTHGVRLDAYSAGAAEETREGERKDSKHGVIVTRPTDYLPQQVSPSSAASGGNAGAAPVVDKSQGVPGLTLSRSLALAQAEGWAVSLVREASLWDKAAGRPTASKQGAVRAATRPRSPARVSPPVQQVRPPVVAAPGEQRLTVAVAPKEQVPPAAPAKQQRSTLSASKTAAAGASGRAWTGFNTDAANARTAAQVRALLDRADKGAASQGEGLGPFSRMLASVYAQLNLGGSAAGRHVQGQGLGQGVDGPRKARGSGSGSGSAPPLH